MKQLTAIFTKSAMAMTFMVFFMMSAAIAGTGVVSITANGGSCLAYTPAQSNGPDNWEVAEGGSYTMTITGVTECSGTEITVFVQSSSSGNFCFTATGGNGTYAGTFSMPDNSCHTMPISYKCGDNQSCDNANTFNAQGPSGSSSVHFRMSTFDGDCARTGADNDCEDDEDELPPTIDCSALGGDLGCNPTSIPAADDNAPIVDGSCDPFVVTHGIDDIQQSGCNYTLTRTYTVTDNCDQTATCTEVYTYTVTGDFGFDNLPEGGELGCNPTLPTCGTVTASNSCGTVSATCTPGAVSNVGNCGKSQTFSYHAESSCGATADQDVTYTWSVSTTVSIAAVGNTTVCSPNCVTINATAGFSSYVWKKNGNPIAGATNSSISACETGTYSVSVTNSCGCTSASNSVSITINPTPTCTLTAPAPLPVCGLTNQTLTATITGAYTNIQWNVTPASWVITLGQGTPTIKYTAGPGGTTATFTVTVTNSYGCSSTCTVSYGSRCEEHCGYTQGFYSGTGKICDGTKTALQAINAALTSGGNLVNGLTGRSVTILTTEGGCLNGKMPGGTAPANLPAGTSITCAGLTGTWLNSGKIKNVLLGQTIALGLNVRNDASLGSMAITGTYVTTYKASSCTNGVAVGSNRTVRNIPQSVLNCLATNGNNTVQGLLNLANQTLAGTGPCASNISDVNAAVDAINNAFDACRILGGFGNSSAGLREMDFEETVLGADASNLELAVFPNPTSTQSEVLFRSSVSGQAELSLFDMSGQKVASLYNGVAEAGEPLGALIDVNNLQSGIYLLNLTVDGQSTFQKVVVMK